MADGSFGRRGLKPRFQSQFPIASIAQLIAKKPVTEEDIRLKRSQEKRAKFNQFLNTISQGAQVARLGQQIGAAKNQATQSAALGESLAQQVPGALPQGVQGPLQQGVFPQQQALRSAAQIAPAQAGQAAISLSFPELAKKRAGGGKSPLGSLAIIRKQLSDDILFETDPNIRKGLEVRRDQLDKRISALGGFEAFKELPEAEVQEPERTGPGIIQRTKNFFRGEDKVPGFVTSALEKQPLGTEVTTKDGSVFTITSQGIKKIR